MLSQLFYDAAAISNNVFLGLLGSVSQIIVFFLSGLLASALLIVIWRCVCERKSPRA